MKESEETVIEPTGSPVRARIGPVQPPYGDEIQASFDKLMPPGMEPLALFRTVAHNPRVLRRM